MLLQLYRRVEECDRLSTQATTRRIRRSSLESKVWMTLHVAQPQQEVAYILSRMLDTDKCGKAFHTGHATEGGIVAVTMAR